MTNDILAWPLLSITVFLPLAGALFVALTRSDGDSSAPRRVALLSSGATLAAALAVWALFDPFKGGFQMIDEFVWLPGFGSSFKLGVDGVSLFFVVATAALAFLCVLWRKGDARLDPKRYMLIFLLVESMTLGTFLALDLTLFYVFFEGALIPLFFLIGTFGAHRRRFLAYKFFILSLVGSALLLLAFIMIYRKIGTTDLETAISFAFSAETQFWLWPLLFIAFAVRTPLFPFHGWLPELSAALSLTSVALLCGAFVKIGLYGFLRFVLPLAPFASQTLAPVAFGLAAATVICAALAALVQTDVRRLVAYLSIMQAGVVVAAFFTISVEAIEGALMLTLAHGVAAAALLLALDVADKRFFRGDCRDLGGLAGAMPRAAAVFIFFAVLFVGAPGGGAFVGLFLIVLGTFGDYALVALVAAASYASGAILMVSRLRRVFIPRPAKGEAILDLRTGEGLALAPLALLALWMGLYPTSFLGPMHVTVEKLAIECLMGANPPLGAMRGGAK